MYDLHCHWASQCLQWGLTQPERVSENMPRIPKHTFIAFSLEPKLQVSIFEDLKDLEVCQTFEFRLRLPLRNISRYVRVAQLSCTGGDWPRFTTLLANRGDCNFPREICSCNFRLHLQPIEAVHWELQIDWGTCNPWRLRCNTISR